MAAAFHKTFAKTYNDKVSLILFLAFISLLPLIVLLGNYALLISNDRYLFSLAAATATPQLAEPEVADSAVAEIAADVVAYVKGDKEALSYASYFRQEEISHLVNVRGAVSKSFFILYFLAAAALISVVSVSVIQKNVRNVRGFAIAFRRALFAAGLATSALALLTVVFSFFNFDFAFAAFHAAIFQNSQWQFPSNYLLVNLFTTDFFAKLASDVVLSSLLTGAVMVVLAAISGKLFNLLFSFLAEDN